MNYIYIFKSYNSSPASSWIHVVVEKDYVDIDFASYSSGILLLRKTKTTGTVFRHSTHKDHALYQIRKMKTSLDISIAGDTLKVADHG